MSSARISAHKGGAEVLPGTAAVHRTGDMANASAGFAAALGALSARFQTPSHHHAFTGSDDASTNDDQTDAQAADDGQPEAAGNASDKPADVPGDATAPSPIVTLPGLGGWSAATGNEAASRTPPANQRGAGKPSPAATGVAAAGTDAAAAAAAAIAAALVAPPAQAPDSAEAGASTAWAASTAPASTAAAGAARPSHPGFGASILPAAAPQASPAETASPDGNPHVASMGAAAIGVAATGKPVSASPADPTPPAPVPSTTTDAGLDTAAAASSDPSAPAIATGLSAAHPTQAAIGPAPATRAGGTALAAAAPDVAAIVTTVTSSAGGSGTRDFSDSGREGQAAAAAAFSGVAAAGTTGPAAGGGDGPSVGPAPASGAGAGADGGAGNVATQLSGQVLRLLANSGHEAVVRLYPADLGEVTVRVAVSGRDVSAWFGASQPAVQQSISAGLGQLQADLGNAGYSLNNAWVGADASGYGSRGNNAAPPSPFAAATQAAPVTPVAAAPSSSSGVNIYV
jgi:flagellar hook-length control protein FliK